MLTNILFASGKENQWETTVGVGTIASKYNPISSENTIEIPGETGGSQEKFKNDIECIIKKNFLFFRRGLGNNYVAILNNNVRKEETPLTTIHINNIKTFLKDFFQCRGIQGSDFLDKINWCREDLTVEPTQLIINSDCHINKVQEDSIIECLYMYPFCQIPDSDNESIEFTSEMKTQEQEIQNTFRRLQKVDKKKPITLLYDTNKPTITYVNTSSSNKVPYNLINYNGNISDLTMAVNDILLFQLLFDCQNKNQMENSLLTHYHSGSINKNFVDHILLFYLINYCDSNAFNMYNNNKKVDHKQLNKIKVDINNVLREFNHLYVKRTYYSLRPSLFISLTKKEPIIENGTVLNKRKKTLFMYLQIDILSTYLFDNINSLGFKVTKHPGHWVNETIDVSFYIGYFINEYICVGTKIGFLPVINYLIRLVTTGKIDNIVQLIFFLVTRFLTLTLQIGIIIISIMFDLLTYTLTISTFLTAYKKNFTRSSVLTQEKS